MIMKSEYPEPWSLSLRRDCCDEYYSVIDPIGLVIPDDLSDSAASLIVAAPDLYKMLDLIVKNVDLSNNLRIEAEMTLKKARG